MKAFINRKSDSTMIGFYDGADILGADAVRGLVILGGKQSAIFKNRRSGICIVTLNV